MKLVVFSFVFLFLLSVSVSSLGLTPAIREIDFKPGEVVEIGYSILSADPDKEMEIFLGGDLAAYARVDKTKVKGSSSFRVTITFPAIIETPGPHRLSVGVREVPSEDEFLGTNVDVRAVIKVFVPYPGLYAESSLSIPDGNLDEQIPVELHVHNRGKESFSIAPEIDFYNPSNEVVETMDFQQVSLEPNEGRFFRKYFNASGIEPGNYFAEASFDYGVFATTNKSFRVGFLFVRINNYTTEIEKGGINKFFVNVESRWNTKLPEVFADVNISNATSSVVFRTPSVDLSPWEAKELVGFLDTEGLQGLYDTKIKLSYLGHNTSESGKLRVYEPLSSTFVIWIVAGIVLVLAIISYFIYRRKKK